jgi:surfeit locus 1 family protein
MFRAGYWQWERYLYKVELLKTYEQDSLVSAQNFPTIDSLDTDLSRLVHRKVRIEGEYDYSRQMIVINRAHKYGAGYWLLTPLKLKDQNYSIIVSRGFIPFEDRTPESWGKYTFSQQDQFDGVLQETVRRRTFLTPDNPQTSLSSEFERVFLYPDIERIVDQLPYQTLSGIFVQRLGNPPSGQFPAQDVAERVPPSTHFGYWIEWNLLGLATLLIGFLMQAFPRGRLRKFKVS